MAFSILMIPESTIHQIAVGHFADPDEEMIMLSKS
jgi:hypothetical protein